MKLIQRYTSNHGQEKGTVQRLMNTNMNSNTFRQLIGKNTHYLYTIQTADTEQKVITILKLQIISFEIKKETKTNPLYKG